MVTKWIKNKFVTGLIISLGIIVIITGIVNAKKCQDSLTGYGIDSYWQEADYQDTDRFREYIEKKLAVFMSMAYDTGVMSIYSAEEEYFTGIPEEEMYKSLKRCVNDNVLCNEAYNKIIQNDRNILYAVIRYGRVVFTNGKWTREKEVVCPADYNYEIVYDRWGVAAKKDGEKINIYGNGFYDRPDKWYVPGYSNFKQKEQSDNCVIIFAKKDPIEYHNINEGSIDKAYTKECMAEGVNYGIYTDYGDWFGYNELYELASDINYLVNKLNSSIALAEAGLVIIIIDLFFLFVWERLKSIIILILSGKNSSDNVKMYRRNKAVLILSAAIIYLVGVVIIAEVVTIVCGDYNYGSIVLMGIVYLISVILLAKLALYYLKVDHDNLQKAVEESVKNERMKVELVTNVSHDLKTPLTSIISYVKLLKEEEDTLPDYARDYVSIIDRKAERLKNIVQDVFDISKASSGQLTVNMEEIDFAKLVNQTLADMSDRIDASGLTLVTDIAEDNCTVMADGGRMYRVLQNIIQNALLYSLEGSRIYITLSSDCNAVKVNVSNTSRDRLDEKLDYSERFVRGDSSRSDGGSGLGLSIAKCFTEACGGSLKVATRLDVFTVEIVFAGMEGQE